MPDNSRAVPFSAAIDTDGKIYEVTLGFPLRKVALVGIDIDSEQELREELNQAYIQLEEYRDKLIELGVIEIPKSAEQIAIEQAEEQREINREFMMAIKGLTSKIEKMEAGGIDGAVGYGGDVCEKEPGAAAGICAEQLGGDSEVSGEEPAGDKPRPPAGKRAAAKAKKQ